MKRKTDIHPIDVKSDEGFYSVRQRLWTTLREGKATECPCCERYAKITPTHLHFTMVKQLLKMKWRGMQGQRFVRSRELADATVGTNGCMTTTKHWGFVLNGEDTTELSGTKGAASLWTISQKGLDFIAGKIAVPKFCLLYDDKVYGWSDELVFVTQLRNFNPEDMREEIAVNG